MTVEKQYDTLFTSKYNVAKNELKERYSELNKKVNDVGPELQNEITKIQAMLAKIKASINSNTKEFNDASEKQKQEFVKKLKSMKAKHNSEIRENKTESEKKLASLQQSSEEKQKKMTSEYETQVRKLKAQFSAASGSEARIEALKRLKLELRTLKSSVEASMSLAETMKVGLIRSMEKSKEKAREFMKHYAADKSAFDNATSLVRSKNEQFAQKCTREALELSSKRAEQKKKYNEELKRIREENIKTLEQLRAKFTKESHMYREMIAKMNSKFSDILDSQKKIREDRKQEITHEESAVKSIVDELTNQVKLLGEANAKSEGELKKSRKASKMKHKTEQKSVRTSYKEEADALMNIHKEECNELVAKVDQANSAQSQTQKMHSKVLLQLNNEKSGMIKKHETDLKCVDDEERNAIAQLMKIWDEEKMGIESEESSKVIASQELYDTNLERKLEQCEAERDALQRRLENEYTETMARIRAEYETDWKCDIERPFQLEFNKEHQKFLQISPPSLNDNEHFICMTKTMDELSIEKSELKCKIGNERKSIISQFECQIQKENERHAKAMKPTSSGRANVSTKQIWIQKITNVRNAAEEQCQSLRSELNTIIENHRLSMQKLSEIQKEAESTTEIDTLKAELETVNVEGSVAIEEAQKRCDSDIKAAVTRNRETELDYERKLQKIQNEIDLILRSRDLDVLKEQLKENYNICMQNWNFATTEYIQSQSQLRSHHLSNLQDVKQQLEHAKDREVMDEEEHNSELNNLIDSYERMISEMSQNHEKECGQKRIENISIVDFLNEMLEMLERRLNQAMRKYEERPARECDLLEIAKLENAAELLMTRIRHGAKDLTHYRKIMFIKDHEYHHKFGQTPKVAVLRFRTAPAE